MSLVNCVKYFRSIGLKRSLQEHKNPFSWKDIPSTTFDRVFHIQAISFPTVKQNQIDLELEIPITVRLFIRGFADVMEAKDRLTGEIEAFFTLALKAENRLAQPDFIKNVRLISVFIETFDESNDNWIVGRMEFSIKFIKPIESEV